MQRVTLTEITLVLSDVNWDEEFVIPGKNTHVCLVLNSKIVFTCYTQYYYYLINIIKTVYYINFLEESRC